MIGEAVIYSSNSEEWETPGWLFDELNQKYHFTMDVCATKENAKCNRFFTKQENALVQNWSGVCWMNPPYGKEICVWMKKAYEAAQAGNVVVCLVPSRTDTKWWHDYAMKGDVVFIRGRLKFGGSINNAPFPSAIVVFGSGNLRKHIDGGVDDAAD